MFCSIDFQVLPPSFSAPWLRRLSSQSVVWLNTCLSFFLFLSSEAAIFNPSWHLLVLFNSSGSEVYDGLFRRCVFACAFSPAIARHESRRRRVPATDGGWYDLHISCGPEWMCPAGPAASSARSGLCLSSGTTNHPHFLSSLWVVVVLLLFSPSQISLLSFSRSFPIWRRHFEFLAIPR